LSVRGIRTSMRPLNRLSTPAPRSSWLLSPCPRWYRGPLEKADISTWEKPDISIWLLQRDFTHRGLSDLGSAP
jgi:hypothetical protein